MTSGATISRYRITGSLGKGGMGVVYQAEDTRLHRPVALKFLPPDSLEQKDKRRLFNEARAAALIRHPNVCPIYDVEEADGQVFIAMAYLEGETLSRKIARGPLDIGLAIDIAIQIASGLQSAHDLGIIHRDIKSSNVIVSDSGHASILDFGLALRSGADRLTIAGGTVGTPAYMSPEQARGSDVDRRTDIWSLGVVLFEMLTGSRPFRRDHDVAEVHSILSDEAPKVSAMRTDAPAALQKVIETALAKQPERRWQRAGDMAAELRRIQEARVAVSGGSTETLMVKQSASRAKRRAVAALALLCVAVSAGFVYYRVHERPRTAQQTTALRPAADARQVALLPFQVIGSGESARTIADGLLEILTAALSDFERFQGKIMAIPASEIRSRQISSVGDARRLYGVSQAITGSAQPLGDRLQFTLSLIDAAQVRQMRARTFEYDPANPMESRNRAVAELAKLLDLDFTSEARRIVTAGDSTAQGAYAAYLEGRGLLSRYDVRGNFDKAIDSFHRATESDPNYALAFAGLGEAYWRKARLGDRQAAALAVQNAERAVKLDPGLPIVHSVLGEVYGTIGREEDAILELQKAMQLAPSNAEAPRELARIYANLGRFQEAEASYQQAIKSRPTDWYGHMLLGIFYYERQRYMEAEAAHRRALELAPDNEIVSRNLGFIYAIQGRYQEATEQLEKSLRSKGSASSYSTLGSIYYRQRRFQEAVSALETAIDLDSSRYYYWGNLGAYYKWVPGNDAKAGLALRRAIDLGEKLLEITPTDYDVRANLAEYRARLKDAKGSLAEIRQIPEKARGARALRLVIAYELIHDREKAIDIIRSHLTSPASLNQIKDDPDLLQLWTDPAFQKAIEPSTRGSAR